MCAGRGNVSLNCCVQSGFHFCYDHVRALIDVEYRSKYGGKPSYLVYVFFSSNFFGVKWNGLRSERQIAEGYSVTGRTIRGILLERVAGGRTERRKASAFTWLVSSVQESRPSQRTEQRCVRFSFRWKAPFQLQLN